MHRFTERLRLAPIGPEHADGLWQLHQDPDIAAWYGGTLTRDAARQRAALMGERWRARANFLVWLHLGLAIGMIALGCCSPAPDTIRSHDARAGAVTAKPLSRPLVTWKRLC